MQKHHLIKRMACATLSLILLLSVFVMGLVPASAAKEPKVTKTETRYEIAVVFDNSGSMYENQSKAWCQAKYAMEIFASMLDYENDDKLSIFPMWNVTTDGSKPKQKDAGSYKRIEINDIEQIDRISNLFSVDPGGTPFAPVKEANDYLKSVDDDCEKWLIVLTDGDFKQEDRDDAEDPNFKWQKRLSEMATDGIHVQYLGFGKDAIELTDDSEKDDFYAKKSTAKSLKDDLIEICNSIFQRTVLENEFHGSNLELEMSMKKIIVFAQGSNAKIESLENAKEKIDITSNSQQRKYSEISANDHVKKDGTINKCSEAKPDKTLAGQVVTFAACKKGNYTLNVTGAEKVQIFYEPDVDIYFKLKNKKNGKTVDLSENKKIVAGEYSVECFLMDRGEEKAISVMDHKLMGTTSLEGTLVGSNGKEIPFKDESVIDLQPDPKLYFRFVGHYLNDYTITTDLRKKDFTFEVIAEEEKLDIKAKCKQKGNWYNLQKSDEWQPIYVSVKVNGKPVSDEKLESMKIEFSPSSNEALTYKTKMLPGKSAYEIYVGENEKGEFVKPENGIYTLSVKGSYIDKYDRAVKGDDSTTFEIQPYSQIWRWLIYVIIFAVLLALFLLFMSRKVLPKKLIAERNDFYMRGKRVGAGSFVYDRKAKTLTLKSMSVPSDFEAECKATFKLYPVDNRWTSSKNRRIGVNDVTNVSMGVTGVNLDTVPLDRKKGKFVVRTAPEDPIQEEIKNPTIRIDTKRSSYLDMEFRQK